jgi:putative transcriptional regulator
LNAFLTGQCLIAMPGIGDPRFERAVVLMCAHNDEHAVGLALNQPIDGLTVPDLFEKLDIKTDIVLPPDPVLLGGPVQTERGFVLHTDDYVCDDASVRVCEGVALTATREVLVALGDPTQRPRRSLMALGYAGWGAGQLEQEIQENVWLTCEADDDLLFAKDYGDKWARALAKLGIEPGMLSGQAGRA